MASDNIKDVDRGRFERLFYDTQRDLITRFIDEKLDPSYVETVLARMLTFRAGACGDALDIVSERVRRMAVAYEIEQRETMKAARDHVLGTLKKKAKDKLD